MRPLAPLLVIALASCATLGPGPTRTPPPGPPATVEGDRVCLDAPTAAYLAGAETCCQDCLVELRTRPAEISPWLVGAALVVGVAAGAGAAYGVMR